MKITEDQLRKYIRKLVKENLANLGDKKATPFGKKEEEKEEKEEPKNECAGDKKLEEAADLGIRAHLSPEENQQLEAWLGSEGGLDLPGDLEEKLYDYYADEIPYEILKGREGDPQEWLYDRLHNLYGESRINLYGEDCGKPHKESALSEGVADRFEMLNRFQGGAGLTDEEMLDELVRQMSDAETEQAFDYIAAMHDLSSTFRFDLPGLDRYEIVERAVEEMGGDASMVLDAVVRQMSDAEAHEAFEYMSRMHDIPFEEEAQAPVDAALVQEDPEPTVDFFKEEDESDAEETVSEASDGSDDVEGWEDSKPAPGPRDLERDLAMDEGVEPENNDAEPKTLEESGYQNCACRDCMEIAIGEEGAYCEECLEAGCPESLSGECEAPGAYNSDDIAGSSAPDWLRF